MSEPLVFSMGEFPARFPTDRRYAKNHMWGRHIDGGWQFGLSAYAVRLLRDVYFLDWCVDRGAELRAGDEIGAIESSKAESSLYAPIGGRLVAFNPAVLADPSAINVDTYQTGWLMTIDGDGEGLMGPTEYLEHLGAVWEVTQRTIKGQMSGERSAESGEPHGNR